MIASDLIYKGQDDKGKKTPQKTKTHTNGNKILNKNSDLANDWLNNPQIPSPNFQTTDRNRRPCHSPSSQVSAQLPVTYYNSWNFDPNSWG